MKVWYISTKCLGFIEVSEDDLIIALNGALLNEENYIQFENEFLEKITNTHNKRALEFRPKNKENINIIKEMVIREEAFGVGTKDDSMYGFGISKEEARHARDCIVIENRIT